MIPPRVEVVPDQAALARRAADAVLDAARRALAERGAFALAASGGETPRGAYLELARRGAETDFARWDVFLADERVVPAGDPRSNARLLRETLIAGARPAPRLHAPPIELGEPDAIARAYEADLRASVERLDLVLLGVGADGHTASLFPGDPALSEDRRLVAPARVGSELPRVTLTYPAIALARAVILLARGAEKRDALRAALAGVDVPLTRVRAAERPLWIVDRAASPLVSS